MRRFKYRELLKLLRQFGVKELPQRGKGSERIWERLVNVEFIGADEQRTRRAIRRTATVTCHGKGKEIPVGLLKAILRRLWLTKDRGIDQDLFR